MTIILDLDYTLLDTGRFKEALASVFADCGIDKKRFLRSYRQIAEHDLPAYDYDLNRHVNLLAEDLKCSPEDLYEGVDDVISRTTDFLYPGAKQFVERLREMGLRVFLLSLGNMGWQKVKVEHSGLGELFDKTVLIRSNKENSLARFADAARPVIVVNDNSDEVKAMKEAEPSFNYIIKRGPKGVREDADAVVLDTFDEIIEEIQRIIS